MALVDHHQGVVFLSQGADRVERRGVAVHREYAVGADDAEALRLGLLETLLQFAHVGVGVAVAHGLRQAHAVDDRGVVERIGDDRVLGAEKRFENAAVGVEAGGVENRILRAEIVGDSLFQFFVDILASADETYGRHAVAAAVHGAFGRFDQPWIVRQPEIIVGAEVQYLTACHLDVGALGRSDDPLPFVKSSSLDRFEFLPQMIFDFSVHGLYFVGFPLSALSIRYKYSDFFPDSSSRNAFFLRLSAKIPRMNFFGRSSLSGGESGIRMGTSIL